MRHVGEVRRVAATALAAWLLAHYGWRTAFFGPAVWVGLVGILVLAFLVEKEPEQKATRSEVKGAARDALRNPIVWLLGGIFYSNIGNTLTYYLIGIGVLLLYIPLYYYRTKIEDKRVGEAEPGRTPVRAIQEK